MAKNSIRDYSATNSSNTDIQSIDISEGCSPAGINNAIREVMADLKDVSTGAVALESPAADSLSVTGDLTVDTTTLYVDSTNNRVGIGTSSPSHILHTSGTGQTAKFESSNNSYQIELNYNNNTSRAFVGSFSNGLVFAPSSASEAMRIDSSGRVGIGTSSPDNKLTIGDSSSIVVGKQWGLDFQDTGKGEPQAFIYAEGRYDANYNTDLIFGTIGTSGSATERLRINASGSLLAGTTSATAGGVTVRTHIAGSEYGLGISVPASGAQQNIRFVNGTTAVGSVNTNGSSTTYATSSDYRLKENVVADWDATTRLKQLNPVRFNFIADPDTTVDGFLAHEVQDVVPEAISGTKDGMVDEEYQVSAATGDIYTPAIEAVLDEDGNEVTPAVDEVIHSTDVERPEELAEGQQWRETTAAVMGTRSVPDYQGIDQSKLVPLLVKTIQELEARITALEAN